MSYIKNNEITTSVWAHRIGLGAIMTIVVALFGMLFAI